MAPRSGDRPDRPPSFPNPPSVSRGNADGKELHVAPMVDVSFRDFRAFLRILTKRTVLWTPMIVDETIVQTYERGGLDLLEQDHLGYVESGNPAVCQIGGNNPTYAREASRLVARHFGFDEINLNLGCPSSKVAGRNLFGCALMRQPETSKNMIRAMLDGVQGQDQQLDDDGNDFAFDSGNNTPTSAAAKPKPIPPTKPIIPVSAKTRIGIDDQDSVEFLISYLKKLYEAGCRRFVIHARKAVTNGISPEENRNVPPLNYDRVYKVCEEFPDCLFWINGGLKSLSDAKNVCYGSDVVASGSCEEEITAKDKNTNVDKEFSSYSHPNHRSIPCIACGLPNGSCVAPPQGPAPSNLVGAMLGRAAINDVAVFADADRYFYGEKTNPCRNRREALGRYCDFLEKAFPRRCCDDIDEMTHCIYLPRRVKFVHPFCDICQDVYGENVDRMLQEGSGSNVVEENDEEDNSPFRKRNVNESCHTLRRLNRKCPGAKITTGVMVRALKPTLGLFARMTGSKWYRRRCEELSKDAVVRNCGPGYVIRKLMKEFPGNALDQDFVPPY